MAIIRMATSSRLTPYHVHSLAMAIIGMAQTFVGSNNINLLMPNGQFGTRLQGGSDAASPRYIFTLLSQMARIMFHENDDPILKYQTDDGQAGNRAERNLSRPPTPNPHL
ncbi:DNA topoisomerase [Baffinella frigidus]|nr:DNA topoisomerase [Cryptophyta sp. CCMP2293]